MQRRQSSCPCCCHEDVVLTVGWQHQLGKPFCDLGRIIIRRNSSRKEPSASPDLASRDEPLGAAMPATWQQLVRSATQTSSFQFQGKSQILKLSLSTALI